MQDSQGINGYITVEGEAEAEQVIQKSRFIGRCFPVESEDAALAKIAEVKKSCWDATHNCYAFRIGCGGSLSRSSDDGEPSGTAGVPILNVLMKQNLTDVLVIVTRYFGGILLGAGGLVRAYGGSAAEAVKAAGIRRMVLCERYDLTVSYPVWSTVERPLRRLTDVQGVSFTETVCASFYIPATERDSVLGALKNLLDGRVEPVLTERSMRAVSADRMQVSP